MAVINTNITALIGQQNLTRSQSALQTSMERLSSGLRINSAADDAAGQAIANRMSAQITGLSQAQRNANDGISVAQTAEGALNQVNDNLQRIRELTVQAANGTNSDSDLSSIQNEIKERLAEINRVSAQTSFNGVNVLAQDQTLSIQVGSDDGQTIDIQLSQINADTLGLGDFDVTEAYGSGLTTVTTADKTQDTTIDFSGVSVADLDDTGGTPTVEIGRADDGNYYANVTGGDDAGYYAVTMGDDGFTINAIDLDADDKLTTGQPTGYAQALTAKTPTGESVDIDTSSLTPAGGAAGGTVSSVVQDSNGNYYVQVTGADSDAGNGFYAATIDDGVVDVADWTAPDTNLPNGANISPLDALDNALSQVDELRSNLGAMQNRFESAIENLGTTTTNLSAARSRIEDADYAVEVSNMTRAQILQQAGTSVLAQANQVPQTVLQLLR